MQSEKKPKYKPLATEAIVIDDDYNPVPYKAYNRSRKRKKSHRTKHKREVKVDRFQNMETLVITQKVEVKKQKFKCIINLTNICERTSTEKAKSKQPSISLERIVPQCLRKCSRQQVKRIRKQESSKHVKKKCPEPKDELDSLSPISLSSLGSHSKLTYEDISSGSFTTIPSDDDIDTLIKRTKDIYSSVARCQHLPHPSTTADTYSRERKLCKPLSRHSSRNITTPPLFDCVSDAETANRRSSDKDSLHSTATLVIAPLPEIYSPTNPTGPDNYMDKQKKSHNYSHGGSEEQNFGVHSRRRLFSPVLSCYDRKKVYSGNTGTKISSRSYRHSCDIKNEPYSSSEEPICSYQDGLPYEVSIEFDETVDLIGKTEKPKRSLDIEGNPRIKVEGGHSPITFNSIPRNKHSKVKVENDINGNINHNSSVHVKSEKKRY